MRTFKSSGLLVLAAVTALVGTSLPAIGLMPGQASLTTAAPAAATTASAGTLKLTTTSSAGTVTWDGQVQRFREASQCLIVQDPGAPELLVLEGFVGDITATAGFRNGDIGVFEPDGSGDPANAAQCSLVDAGSFTEDETLGLRLGADAVDASGALVATSVSLLMNRSSKSGTISIELLDADGGSVATDEMSWQGGRPGGALPVKTLTGEFAEIRLTADSGSFSLRGADFALASQADDVFCTEGSDDTFTNEAGVKVTFIGTADGSPCDGFGIRLTGDDISQVHFIKPLDVNPEAQFIFEITWNTVGWPALTPGSELPQALIDFEEVAPPNQIEREMPYCPDYLFDESGTLVGLDGDSSQADRDALALLDMVTEADDPLRADGTQFACIGDRDTTVQKSTDGDGYDVDIIDLIYLIGDARMSLK